MRRQVPLLIVFITGIIMTLQYFVPSYASQRLYDFAIDWLRVIGSFAVVLGVYSISFLHIRKIQRRAENWQYSIILLLAIPIMMLFGFIGGTREGSPYSFMLNYVMIPINATMFSLLAFYIASAAYRSFRARSSYATALLIAAIIIMLGRVSLPVISDKFAIPVTEWILNVPNLAAKRGIMLGVGLGMMATSMKIILGIERSYLGGGQ
jgi:putative Mn2+ efflux pump MntP